MKRLTVTILAALLIFSSYAYAIPVEVEFTGTLDPFGIARLPDGTVIPNDSTMYGRFFYDTTAVGTGTGFVTATGHETYWGSSLFLSINDTYNYGSSSISISLDQGGAYDELNVNAGVAPQNSDSPQVITQFYLQLIPSDSYFTSLSLPETWNSDVWNLHGGDRDAIILGSETTSGFNVDSISSDPVEPVPEPSTFLLFAAGVCGVGYWRRRIQNSILVSQQKKLGFLGKGSPDSRRP